MPDNLLDRTPAPPKYAWLPSASLPMTRRSQLQPRLDNPDRIGGGSCNYTSEGGGCEMDIGVFHSAVEVVGNNVLAVAICVKIDRARRDDAYESGTETFEEGPGGFFSVDVSGGLMFELWS